MKTRRFPPAAAAAVLFLVASSLAAEDAAQLLVRRFALVVGCNDGGAGRVRLKFAATDAEAFAGVMRGMGGVEAADLVLLLDPSAKGYDDAVGRVRSMAAGARRDGERRELVFYYSGHSDEEGLILGGQTVAYERIRSDLSSVPVDVRVAVLDSCSSGALTRAKGGVQRPAFLFDASADMKGHAFLTSSSAEEAAQESDAIGASFFTHYLVSGLRGAADSTGDRVVTLNEAYHFAFKETLASTERTQFGPQHPAYDINLTGSGDLVLTDLRAASAGLVIPEDVSGRLYIRDARGALTVELAKPAGQKVEFGLEPGTYTVTIDADGRRSQATVRIAARRTVVLEASSLAPVATAPTRPRGNAETADGSPEKEGSGRLASDVAAVVQDALQIAREAADAARTAVAGAMGEADGTLRAAREKADAARKAPEPPKPEKPEAPARKEKDAEQGKTIPVEAFHLSFLPDVVFGGLPTPTRRVLSVNVLFGFGHSVAGAEFNGLGSLLLGDVAGLQASGIINFVNGGVAGAQLAGILNFTVGSAGFLQAAGCVNLAGGDLSGTQLSGIAGIVGPMDGGLNGLQASGIASFAKDGVRGLQASGIAGITLGAVDGAQISGIGSFAPGGVHGLQASGILGLSLDGVGGAQISGIGGWTGGSLSGAQVSGIANWTSGDLRGAQIAGIFNRAGSVTGPQIGLLNLSGDVNGAQVGLVNVGRDVKGTQIGLVNYSRQFDGVPVGLLNIEEKGRQRIEAWWDFDGSAHGALAIGTRRFYTIVTGSWIPQSDPVSWSWGAGFGARWDLGDLFLEGDLTANNMHQGTGDWLYGGVDRMMPMGRVQLGLPLGDRMAISGGVALRLTTPWSYRVPGTPEGTDLYLAPSFFCGARL